MTLVQYEASWQIRLTLKGSGFRIGSEGQIAQLVEHSPEKAGVAGSSPALSILLKSFTQQAFMAHPEEGPFGAGAPK